MINSFFTSVRFHLIDDELFIHDNFRDTKRLQLLLLLISVHYDLRISGGQEITVGKPLYCGHWLEHSGMEDISGWSAPLNETLMIVIWDFLRRFCCQSVLANCTV